MTLTTRLYVSQHTVLFVEILEYSNLQARNLAHTLTTSSVSVENNMSKEPIENRFGCHRDLLQRALPEGNPRRQEANPSCQIRNQPRGGL